MQDLFIARLLKYLESLFNLKTAKQLFVCLCFCLVMSKSLVKTSYDYSNLAPLKSDLSTIVFKEELSILNIDPEFRSFLGSHEDHFLKLKLVKLLPRNIRHKAKSYLTPIIEVSNFYGIDPLWAISIVWTESHFKVHSKSHVGAKGLMQLMPKTQKYLERKMKGRFQFSDKHVQIPLSSDFYDKQLRNIEIGVHYLYKLQRRFSHRKLATVAYNMGPTWTRRRMNRKQKIGNRNEYLDKVSRSYNYITKRL